jgi:hypothetical protein
VVTKFLFFRASKIVLAANAAEKNPWCESISKDAN